MKRRDFLRQGTLAGAATAFTTSSHAALPVAKSKTKTGADPFVLNEATIDVLQQKMQSGKLSSEKITRLYLDRIKAIDQTGPRLRCVIERNPDAIAIAKQMDAERKSGKLRGPLHGIPVLIKDNIDTADKMQTTAGSLALAGHIAQNDAFIVSKLRAAGAVLLGKTNLSEWANFRSTSSCSGWSSRGGQTKMPYILDHNPCGSSSGSGVAVSANLCAIAIGTETDGSITCPSSVNGIAGIKPTVGLWSRSGIIPISATQDTAGPMARTVKDVAIMLGLLAGVDEKDAATKDSEGKTLKDYTQFCEAGYLKGKRLGVNKKKYDNQFLNRLQEKAIADLKQLGAEVIELDYLSKLEELSAAELDLLEFEFKDGLNRYLATANAKVKNIEDIIAFNKANEDTVMPGFKQEIMESSAAKAGLDGTAYKEAYEKSHLGSQKIINQVMAENKLDALVGLTMGPSCSIDTVYGDRWGNVFLTLPAATSGYPHITVPAGKVYELPVGLSFFSTAYKEAEIIGLAYAYEQATKHRTPPQFKKAFLD